MSDCVLSNQNRFYVAAEPSFGSVPAITAADRLAAIKLGIRQRSELRERRDKTGGRTYAGVAPGGRNRTEFNLQTYLLTNPSPGTAPPAAKLVQAAMGAAALSFGGSTAGAGSTTTQISFSGSHGLAEGQAFGFNGEIRFVKQVVSSSTVQVNAPFSTAPASGASLTPAVSYFPAAELPSVSIFDYWDPANAVDRILVGAACDRMTIKINGDYHEFEFSGEAQDAIDNLTFEAGQGGLGSFPSEPAVTGNTTLPVPGNLGQAWLGNTAGKFLTITSAEVELNNDLDLRNREFGTSAPQCITAGVRRVLANFELYEVDDTQSRDLYAAARAETPVAVMFQLGEATGQLLGAYMKSVVPQLPEFEDDERILRWNFGNSRAQGEGDDELVVAFG